MFSDGFYFLSQDLTHSAISECFGYLIYIYYPYKVKGLGSFLLKDKNTIEQAKNIHSANLLGD